MRKFLILLAVIFSSTAIFSAGNKTIDNIEYLVDTLAHYQVGPGAIYSKLHFMHKTRPLLVYIYEQDLSNPYVKLKAETSTGTMMGMEQISSIAKRKDAEGSRYFIGTNGDFYNTKTGEPINTFATEGIIGKTPHSQRYSFSVTEEGVPFIDKMSFQASITFGGVSHPINVLNDTARALTNRIVLFNSLQGANSGLLAADRTEVLLELQEGDWMLNSGVKKAKVAKKQKNVGNMAIAKNCIVLAAKGGDVESFLDTLNEGDIVEVSTNLALGDVAGLQSLREVIGGDQKILKDGELFGPDWAEQHPRTGVGFNSDKSKAYLIVVDGRSAFSVGVRTHVLGEIFRLAGASEALNLDGGGSSGMYLEKYGIVNRGSDGSERRVSNAIFAVSTAPDDNTIASLGFTNARYEIPVYSTIKPTVVGYNKYGYLIDSDVPVAFSCPESLGNIDPEKGLVAGSKEIVENLTATYNGVSVKVPISVVNDGIISITRDSVLLDDKREYLIEVKSTLNNEEYPVHPKALTWTVADPTICIVEDGLLKGLSKGRTSIFGELKGVVDTLSVNIEPVENNPYLLTDFSKAENFSFTGSSSNLKNIAFNFDNLPTDWDQGTRVSFTYSKGRYSELKIAPTFNLYSLPDSIEVTLKNGEGLFSAVKLVFLAFNETQSRVVQFGELASDEAATYSYNLRNTYPGDDLSYYPIKLTGLNLELKDSKFTANKEYNIYLKDIKLYYSGYPMGIEEMVSASGNMFVQPNPIKNGEAILNFTATSSEPFKVDIYSLSGQLCKTINFEVSDSNQYPLSLHDLAKGIHVVTVSQKGGISETVKIIVE